MLVGKGDEIICTVHIGCVRNPYYLGIHISIMNGYYQCDQIERFVQYLDKKLSHQMFGPFSNLSLFI